MSNEEFTKLATALNDCLDSVNKMLVNMATKDDINQLHSVIQDYTNKINDYTNDIVKVG